jgi:hypothetical protein
MPIFDQRGQQVTYQYNAAGDINIGAVQDRAELVGEFHKLKGELDKAAGGGALEPTVAMDAKDQLDKAAQQADRPMPNKNVLVGYLTTAQELLTETTAVAGLVAGLAQVIEKVRVLF